MYKKGRSGIFEYEIYWAIFIKGACFCNGGMALSSRLPHISEKASAVKRAYTTEEIERKVTNMVEEYLHNNDVAVSCCKTCS